MKHHKTLYSYCFSRRMQCVWGVLSLLFPVVVLGQLLIMETHPVKRKIAIAVGWDPVWIQETVYSRKLKHSFRQSDVEFNLGLTLPVLALAKPNFKITSGLDTAIGIKENFAVGLGVNGGVVMSDDFTGNKVSIITELTLQPGFFSHNWLLALDLAWRGALATYMRQSKKVNYLFDDRYPDKNGNDDPPENRWFRFTANRIHLGLAGRIRVAKNWSVFGTGGFDYTPQTQGILSNPALGQMPFYVILGGDYRW